MGTDAPVTVFRISVAMTMLYDAGHILDERILAEQFSD